VPDRDPWFVARGSWFADSGEPRTTDHDPRLQHLRWLAIAVVSALACRAVAIYDTPIDRALPFVAVLLVICGWVSQSISAELGVLLLVASAIFLPAERTRLLAYGLIAAAAFAVSLYVARPSLPVYALLTIVGTLLLRWVPFRDVVTWREVIVILGALAVLMALRAGGGAGAPLSVLAALGVALVTPVFPGRAMLFPFLLAAALFVAQALLPVLFIAFAAAAYFDRYSHAPLWIAAALAGSVPLIARFRLRVPAYAAAVALFALWPWSGLVARAFPRFLYATPGSPRQQVIGLALAAGESVSLDVPRVQSVILTASGANTARMAVGRVVGRIDIGNAHRDLRIGDIADFGFLRREQFFRSRNAPPRWPTTDIRGYGQTAWMHGAGRVMLPGSGRSMRITAVRDLPAGARLQIESVDFE
jgi:hypothetical protein